MIKRVPTMKAKLHRSSGGDGVRFDEGGEAVAEIIEGATGVVYVTRRWSPLRLVI